MPGRFGNLSGALTACKQRGGAFISLYMGMLFLAFLPASLPGVQALESPAQDSTRTVRDTAMVLPADTTARSLRGTLPPLMPLERHGALFLTADRDVARIGKGDIYPQLYDAYSTILSENTLAWPLSLGFTGSFNALSWYGAGPRDVQLLYNGRRMNDPAYGAASLDQFPPENIEAIEIVHGAQAVILEDNSAGALLNMQEVRYNTKVPFTRLWYLQGGGDLLASDGVFSQNISRDLTIALGWRSLSADGVYDNGVLDAWNVRAQLRWKLSERTNFSLSELFTNHETGTNGGFTAADLSDISNDVDPQPRYASLSERVYRHDITAAISTYFNADSTDALSVAAYFSTADWNKWRAPDQYVDARDTSRTARFNTQKIGINARLETRLAFFGFTTGGMLEHTAVSQSPYTPEDFHTALAGFGLLHMQPAPALRLSAGLRAAFIREKLHINSGGRLEWRVAPPLELFLDASRSVRTPSLVEGSALAAEDHLLLIAGAHWRAGTTAFELQAFSRRVENPILSLEVQNSTGSTVSTISYNADNRSIFGLLAKVGGQVWGFSLSGFAQFHYSETNQSKDGRFPLLYSGASLEREFAFGASRLQVGARVRGISSFKGERFVPFTWTYVSHPEESGNRFGGLDFFATALIGNASVRFMFQNILSQTYYHVPVYPAQEANIRLSVSWTFFD